MKGLTIAAMIVVFALLGAVMVYAAQNGPSVAAGKVLFNDPKLGTSGKACGTCHPNGSGLEKAGAISDLPKMVNNCISKPLKGKPLDVKSSEMQSLVLYIKSIGAK
ncbi:MAG TPA: cytochrome C [Nitrospirota bacterium]|nr:cytochrome C [Nitrospirota bacterium]